MAWAKCSEHPGWDAIGCPVCKAEHDIMLLLIRQHYSKARVHADPSPERS